MGISERAGVWAWPLGWRPKDIYENFRVPGTAMHINNTDRIGITRDVEMMNEEQLHNVNLLGLLRNKSLAYNKGFLMHVTALSMINREEYLFDLCRRKIRTVKR